MKYIDAEKLYKQVDSLIAQYAKLEEENEIDDEELSIFYQGKRKMCSQILNLIDSLQQEQPNDLASLISEATNVAKRIVDRDSFYNSLPQNLRDKYTSKAWCEILKALSTMKGQEQPKVDIEKEYTEFVESDPVYSKLVNGIIGKSIARHFYELGRLNARKEESK